MAQETPNPFVLPGFGQQGESAQNPLFAGLDMMRQAWQNMAGASHLDAAVMPPMSLDDLERRIRELQTVQNWLQLNATMLASTIQGLEIQRSTLATLKSFAGKGFAEAQAAAGAPGKEAAETSAQPYAQAAEDWWKLVQQQFDTLTAATTASLHGLAESAPAPSDTAPAAGARKTPRKSTASRKTAGTSGTSGAARKTPAARKPRG
jgi:hypothetical protein